MKRAEWWYDEKSGGLFCGAKLVTHFFDAHGRPYARNEEEAKRFGNLIATRMNEQRVTKPIASAKLAHTCSGFGPSLGQCAACNAGLDPRK